MTDIARLGFSADTGDLKKAKADLDALVPSAQKVEKATKGVDQALSLTGGSFRAAAAGAKVAQGSFAAVSAGAQSISRSALMAGTAMGTVQRASIGASSGFNVMGATTVDLNSDLAVLRGQIAMLESQLTRIPAAAGNSASSLNRLGAAANDNINQLQSTPGNIAAQFQDIGVTAAAGMSPMLIALQQGTQLSSAMAGGVGNLLAGFRQLFSVTTILTIGFVGLAAAGLQNVDWMGLAQGLLGLLADGFDVLASAVEQFTVVIIYAGVAALIAFGPALYTAVLNLTALIIGKLVFALGYATAAMIAFSLANPFGAILIAIGLVIAAMALLNDTFGGVFTDILKQIKDLANKLIGAFVGAYEAVKAIWSDLPSVFADLVYQSKRELNELFKLKNTETGEVSTLFSFDLSGGNPAQGAFAAASTKAISAFGRAQGVDYVSAIGDGISSGLSSLSSMVRGWASSIGVSPDDVSNTTKRDSGISELEKIAKAYDDLVDSTKRRIAAIQDETAALSMNAYSSRLYLNEQSLFAQALEKGIPLIQETRVELTKLAEQMTDAEMAKVTAESTKAFNEQMTALKNQRELIGLVGFDLAFAAEKQRLFNEAIANGTFDQARLNGEMEQFLGLIESRSILLAMEGESNRAAQFIDDMTRAHEESIFVLERERGELMLTGAALEAYRIETDLLVDAKRKSIPVDDELIRLIRQQATEYALLSEEIARQRDQIEFSRSVFKDFFSDMIDGLRQGQSVWETFGNAVLNVVNRIIDRLLDMATDDLFDSIMGGVKAFAGVSSGAGGSSAAHESVHGFAKGASFTNGIFSTPTMFSFAKGTALGEMGEAGPEAVMPLKRGADGSLGVQVHGAEQRAPVVVYVQASEYFDARVDERSSAQVVRAAPDIARGGADIAKSEMSIGRRRSLSR